VDADAHVAAEQEGQAAEHSLLGEPGALAEHLLDARSKGLAVCHGRQAA
jgi:hypothetical protein